MGKRKDSINTIAKLRQRCNVRDPKDADCCWIWKGAEFQGKAKVWVVVDGKGSVMNGPRAALTLSGRELPPKSRAWSSCDNPACCNPNHAMFGSYAEWGAWHTANNSAWLFTARRKVQRKLASRGSSKVKTMEVARAIRQSPLSGRKEAKARGLSHRTIISIRLNRTWVEPNPFGGLGER